MIGGKTKRACGHRVLVLSALLAAVVCLGQMRPLVRAQTPALPADLALVPADATLFVRIRFAELWNSDFVKTVRQKLVAEIAKAEQQFRKEFGLGFGDIDTLTIMVPALRGDKKEPPMDAFLADPPVVTVFATSKPYKRAEVVSALSPKPQERKHAGRTYFAAPQSSSWLYFASDRLVVRGENSAELFLEPLGKPATGGKLADALKTAAEKHHLVAGFQMPDFLARQLKQAPLPPEAEFVRPLLELQSGTLTFDVGKDLDYRVTLAFADDAQAKSAAGSLQKALELARQQLAQLPAAAFPDDVALTNIFKQVEGMLKSIKVEHVKSTVQVSARIDAATYLAAILPAVQKVREAANRITSANNLFEIGLAAHNYHEDYRHLPPQAITSKDGKPLLSWRVAILPYCNEEDAQLYKQFKLDEPWDGPNNRKLLEKMPKVYRHPSAKLKDANATVYQAFASKGTVFEPGQKITLPNIRDGTSTTIMVVEAAEGVPWTKPEDLAYDAKKPLPKLGGHEEKGFNVLWCDGSVTTIRKDFDEATLRLAITRDDGMPVYRDKLVKP